MICYRITFTENEKTKEEVYSDVSVATGRFMSFFGAAVRSGEVEKVFGLPKGKVSHNTVMETLLVDAVNQMMFVSITPAGAKMSCSIARITPEDGSAYALMADSVVTGRREMYDFIEGFLKTCNDVEAALSAAYTHFELDKEIWNERH